MTPPIFVVEKMADIEETDSIGCLLWLPILFIFISLGIFFLHAEQAKQITKDMTTPVGHLTGRVKTVETWKADKFTEEQGNLTSEITDRTRITFEDGRSKEFIGIPKDTVPKDKDVAVVWAKFDFLLEILPVEEYNKRKKEQKE